MRRLANRVERLENNSSHRFASIIPVCTAEEAEACRRWWRNENPGLPYHKLLIVITGVPRANAEPWDE